MSKPPPRRWHRWLLVLPFLWQIAMVPFVNGIAARPLGMPFPMAWQLGGIVFASLVLAVVRMLDLRAEAR